MTHLIYHNLSQEQGKTSPFDEAILQVRKEGIVGIVSPYIGVDYLLRIIGDEDHWRLISDIEAWLTSLSPFARPKAWQFIRSNLASIHHCSAIHAKVVIGRTAAMVGSANLTYKGILGRTEMGMLIDDPSMTEELTAWFESLWQQTQSPIAEETNEFIQWLDREATSSTSRRGKFAFSDSGTKIRARLARIPANSAPPQVGSQIQLGDIAKTVLVKEQRQHESLTDVMDSALDALAGQGFSLSEMIQFVRQRLSEASVREVYFLLVQHCANHTRSVFAENTINRLVLDQGRFKQSDKESISRELARFDKFLMPIVEHLDFFHDRDLPDEQTHEQVTGFDPRTQAILISELIGCGFIEINDIPGSLPKYRLSDDFEWSSRFNLFVNGRAVWNVKRNTAKSNFKRPDRDSDGSLSEFIAPSDASLMLYDTEDVASDSVLVKLSLSEYLRTEQEKTLVQDRLRVEQSALRREAIQLETDRILAYALKELLLGNKLLLTPAFIDDVAKLSGAKAKLVRQILQGKESPTSKILALTKNGVVINPDLEWNDLNDYPTAQDICKAYLAPPGK